MLFNSAQFIFLFLPAVLAGFFLLGRHSRPGALAWLTLASLGFYAWWRPLNVAIIGPAILVNYALARWLVPLAADKSQARLARLVLAAGIAFNVLFLGWFKYANFGATVLNDIAGTSFVLQEIILPLGISFITFQKIAFLVDVHARRVTEVRFREYALFVLFFPQLIAGPIVHYREMMPQFRSATARFDAGHVAAGATLFVMGLFKKVVLADGITAHVSPVYALAHGGAELSMAAAWFGALGFTLQIYFDFSGYSDMALGLARLFGVRLPANFDSPLKATSIIDFWSRWHITLTRFLTAYLYNPLALWLTRRRLARGRPPLGRQNLHASAFLELLALPTLLTMLVSGLWHGAGYTFLVWGLLHGVYLVINHAWRFWRQRHPAMGTGIPQPVRALTAFGLTLFAVVVGMVIFRAPDEPTVRAMFGAMSGLDAAGWYPTELALRDATAWLLALSAIAFLLPNSLQLTAAIEPAVSFKPRPTRFPPALASWRPSLPWAACLAALGAAAIMRLGGTSEFLYWQF